MCDLYVDWELSLLKGTFRENDKEQFPVWGFQGRLLIKREFSWVVSLQS